jgi:hypothetical protein
MPGNIRFVHDKKNDIIIAIPEWYIATEQDCESWYEEWLEYLKGFGRKMDCIMVLDNFEVASDMAELWGENRRKLNHYLRGSGHRDVTVPRRMTM